MYLIQEKIHHFIPCFVQEIVQMVVKHSLFKKMLILVIVEIYCKYARLRIGTLQLFLNLL